MDSLLKTCCQLQLDLELTTACDVGIASEPMELLEVGVVWGTPEDGILDRFHSIVRPTERPQLPDFYKRLLPHIHQATINVMPSWMTVSDALAKFAKRHKQPGRRWVSWGSSNYRQVQQESARHGIVDQLAGLPHENFKRDFAKPRRKKIKQVGMGTVRQIVGPTLWGLRYKADDDVLNVEQWLSFCPRLALAAEG